MGQNMSMDEAMLERVGCDTIGSVPCNDSSNVFCLEGECALFVSDFVLKCVEGCKCYPGYFGNYCEFREVSVFATAGLVGAIIGVFLLILLVVIILCCWRSVRKRRRLNREWERQHINPSLGETNSRTLDNQRSEVDNSPDRPRSGLYEHEYLQIPKNGKKEGSPLYPNPNISSS